jgi:hypothetical protein
MTKGWVSMSNYKARMTNKAQSPNDKEKYVWHSTCPLAFAEALAQAGQGSARLLESYGEQAGGAFGFQLAFGF